MWNALLDFLHINDTKKKETSPFPLFCHLNMNVQQLPAIDMHSNRTNIKGISIISQIMASVYDVDISVLMKLSPLPVHVPGYKADTAKPGFLEGSSDHDEETCNRQQDILFHSLTFKNIFSHFIHICCRFSIR